ncbi:MAG: type II toxin-antitoxin system VapC family toxin [Deltaproteobacteria bacterium]|nr:type II toxin-antitoxin system VapC family toxin [Deltaproteobacteria bacterium]
MSSATPANEFVTDTMGLILRLEQRRLGLKAKATFEAMENAAAIIQIPAIVLAEILYLSEKQRINTSIHSVQDYLARFPSCCEMPLNLAILRSAAEITDIPELHDRLIAATTRSLSRPLITNDPFIQASAFVTTLE